MDSSGQQFTDEDAAEILDRLDDSGFKQDVTEQDLLGAAVRQPLRSACSALAAAVLAISPAAPPPPGGDSLQEAAGAVQRAAGSDTDGGGGALDAALLRLARCLQPSSGATKRIQAIEEVVAYLQAARMLAAAAANREPPTEQLVALATAEAPEAPEQAMEIDGDAAAVSGQLHRLAQLLSVPTAGRSGESVTADLAAATGKLIEALPPGFGEPLLQRQDFSQAQLDQLAEINAELRAEHMLRRSMLTERAKVTLQSFLWSKLLKERGREGRAAAAVARGEAAMAAEPAVSVDDVFAFRQADLAAMGARASSGTAGGARASVKSVLIGAVPDRGGRAEGREAQALANMPAFTARKGPPAGGRGGGRGAGVSGRGGSGGGKRHKKK